MTFFSIIIPTYNREKIIPRAIKSILNQSFTDFEIIIVDDGSSDDTELVIKNFQNDSIKYFKTDNFGVAHARNFGIKLAKGKYIGFLDSDDLMETNHLQTAHEFIISKKFPEVIHLNFLWGPENKSRIHKNTLPKNLPDDIFKKCSLHVNCIFIQGVLLKDNLFNESISLMFAEDWDFFIKIATRFKIHLLDVNTCYLVDHEDRNMRNFDEKKWVLKRDAIALSLSQDKLISENYSHKINMVTAHMNSLIAINFAVRKKKRKSLSYWTLSIKQNFKELFTRRSMAIIKHLFLSW
ncbi:MAG: glycosyltransferase [Bacteroidota bacterium]|nr:glycosyltransferase [Bacteroidota bacterium]MDP3144482.1 glycosyltransferase [Bacteroidota bacterium]